MKNYKIWRTIIPGVILGLTLSLPGCKPGNAEKKRDAISIVPTPSETTAYQKKQIRYHKARFSQKWED